MTARAMPHPRRRAVAMMALTVSLGAGLLSGCAPTTGRWPGLPAAGAGPSSPLAAALQGPPPVAATAEGAVNVRPFAGVQQIQGGSYASSRMIRTVVR